MTDKELIDKLGGVLALSNYLDVSYQRVFNWTHRGIPPQVKINHPEILMPKSLKDVKPLSKPEEA